MHVRTRVAVMLDAGFPEHGSLGCAGAANAPEGGDEVLVAFAHADVRDPYVPGFLWNSKDKPPAKAG